MAAVVNILQLKEPVDSSLFTQAAEQLGPQMREIDGFEALHIVQSSEREVVLVILADTVETLDRLAREVGSPWMSANVVPLLAGPPQRHVGTTVASATA